MVKYWHGVLALGILFSSSCVLAETVTELKTVDGSTATRLTPEELAAITAEVKKNVLKELKEARRTRRLKRDDKPRATESEAGPASTPPHTTDTSAPTCGKPSAPCEPLIMQKALDPNLDVAKVLLKEQEQKYQEASKNCEGGEPSVPPSFGAGTELDTTSDAYKGDMFKGIKGDDTENLVVSEADVAQAPVTGSVAVDENAGIGNHTVQTATVKYDEATNNASLENAEVAGGNFDSLSGLTVEAGKLNLGLRSDVAAVNPDVPIENASAYDVPAIEADQAFSTFLGESDVEVAALTTDTINRPSAALLPANFEVGFGEYIPLADGFDVSGDFQYFNDAAQSDQEQDPGFDNDGNERGKFASGFNG